MKRVLPTLVGVVGLATSALAETGWWITTVTYGGGATSLSPANPVARIRVTAGFEGAQFIAFAAGRFDVVATEPGWHGPQVFPVLGGPNTPGAVAGGTVVDIRAGQVHFPPSIPANPANPMVVWEMDWTPANFRPRSVGLSITTRRYSMYWHILPPSRDLTGVTGGQGSIVVTPAPSGLVMVGLGAIVIGWRRR